MSTTPGSPDSGPRLEVSMDYQARMVNIRMWRALDLSPTPISFPFAMFKEVAADIAGAEAQQERSGYRFTPPSGLSLVRD